MRLQRKTLFKGNCCEINPTRMSAVVKPLESSQSIRQSPPLGFIRTYLTLIPDWFHKLLTVRMYICSRYVICTKQAKQKSWVSVTFQQATARLSHDVGLQYIGNPWSHLPSQRWNMCLISEGTRSYQNVAETKHKTNLRPSLWILTSAY
jgi:hypothetical protein